MTNIKLQIEHLSDVTSCLVQPLNLALREPATATAIAQAEAKLEVTFPDDLRSFLLLHNGQKFSEADPIVPAMNLGSSVGPFSEQWLAGLDGILESTQLFREEHGEYSQFERFKTIGPVRNHANFLVIGTTENSDCLAMDLAPLPEGNYGQIVLYCTQPYEIVVVSESLADFLKMLANRYS